MQATPDFQSMDDNPETLTATLMKLDDAEIDALMTHVEGVITELENLTRPTALRHATIERPRFYLQSLIHALIQVKRLKQGEARQQKRTANQEADDDGMASAT